MTLEILEAGHEFAIHGDAQIVELAQQLLLRIELGLGKPGDEIAAHLGREAFVRAATDARGTQRAARVQRQAARAQLGQQLRANEIVDDAEAARGELPYHPWARRRGRSPRRFACGRRLLRACAGSRFGVRRFTGFFFGGHNMVPRQCGEPQRHA